MDEEKKILFVDDERNVLEGFRRQLRTKYAVETAESAEEGLICLKEKGPFAVVVSDMRMPGMDGIEFLSTVRERYSESIRVILTGHADLASAISAVNEGNIFRFITKPCPTDMLEKIIATAFEQYRLMRAERVLLGDTLEGSIDVLVDILSLANPVAFSRSRRIWHFAQQLAKCISFPDVWRVEVAALLSQIGCVTIPSDILEKYYSGQKLFPEEREMLERYPRIGADIIAHIPRMEPVARMIAEQHMDFPHDAAQRNEPLVIGASMLRLAIDFDTLFLRGYHKGAVIEELRRKGAVYNEQLFPALNTISLPILEKTIDMLAVSKIRKGMFIEEELRSVKGTLIAKPGQEVSQTMRVLLENYHSQKQIKSHILVGMPTYLPPSGKTKP